VSDVARRQHTRRRNAPASEQAPAQPAVDASPVTTWEPSTEMEPSRASILRVGERWRGLHPGWRLAIVLVVVQRIFLGIAGILGYTIGPSEIMVGEHAQLVKPGGDWTLWLSTWQRWDGLWYQLIAEYGYRTAEGSTAFYPLYPLLMKVVSVPLLGETAVAGLLVSTVAFAVAVKLLYELVAFEMGQMAEPGVVPRGRRPSTAGRAGRAVTGGSASVDPRHVAVITVLLLALYPSGFFLFAPYTESLFLALTVGCFLYARQGRWWIAGILGFFAALTRAQGALLVLVVGYEYLRQTGTLAWIMGNGGKKPTLAALAVALPALGALTWFAALRLWFGETQSGFALLDRWGYRVVAPWTALADSIVFVFGSGRHVLEVAPELLNFVTMLLFTGLAIVATRRLPLCYALYLWPSLLLLLTREMDHSPLMSVSRYALVVFPCLIAAALLVRTRPRVAVGLLSVGAVAQFFYMMYYAGLGFVA
jgi:hypothetical protein